jgi:hypothetical protein
MTLSMTRRSLSALSGAALLCTAFGFSASAATGVTVQLNGRTLSLSPPPTERAGRVFVPLRGVFENLGASVVYASGTINAQGRGHSVQLHIGSQQATVDGHGVTVDVAPFIVGASTYVPLRFVSQALGATVNWDNTNRIVAIETGGGGGGAAPVAETVTPVPTRSAANVSPVTIGNLLPRRNATIQANKPTIQATFENGTVNANTVHVAFDGRDVTSSAYISDRGVTFTPNSEIPAGKHEVRITGQDSAGAAFDRTWAFTSGGGTSAVSNAITNVSPAPGSAVPTAFTIKGRTDPGSTVTVQVGVASQAATNIGQVVGAILGVGTGGGNTTVQNTVHADANGNFSSSVSIGASSGSTLAVVITSTEPNYGVAATPMRFNLTVR